MQNNVTLDLKVILQGRALSSTCAFPLSAFSLSGIEEATWSGRSIKLMSEQSISLVNFVTHKSLEAKKDI